MYNIYKLYIYVKLYMCDKMIQLFIPGGGVIIGLFFCIFCILRISLTKKYITVSLIWSNPFIVKTRNWNPAWL